MVATGGAAMYAILRVSRVKGGGGGLQAHMDRSAKRHSNEDIDHSRTHLNFDVIPPPNTSWLEAANHKIEQGYTGTRKIRSDAVRICEGLATASHGWMVSKSPEEQRRFFDDVVDFLAQEYGRENLLFATVHMDEKTPHMHFAFVPLTKDGRLSAYEVLGNRKDLSALQDRYHGFLVSRGWSDLERGERGSSARHRTVAEYKKEQALLAADIAQAKAESIKQDLDNLASQMEAVDMADAEIDAIPVRPVRFNRELVTVPRDAWEKVTLLARGTNALKLELQDLHRRFDVLHRELAGWKARAKELFQEVTELKPLKALAQWVQEMSLMPQFRADMRAKEQREREMWDGGRER